jgi:hypothetical protein
MRMIDSYYGAFYKPLSTLTSHFIVEMCEVVDARLKNKFKLQY